jgi:hypothetical protein
MGPGKAISHPIVGEGSIYLAHRVGEDGSRTDRFAAVADLWKAIGPICTLAGAGTGETVAVGEAGTEVDVADGAKVEVGSAAVGVRVGGTAADVAGGSGVVAAAGGWSVAGATGLRVGVCCSSVGGRGVSVGAAGVSFSATGDSTIATNPAGNCGTGMLSEGNCPLKKNAPAMIAAITPVTLVAMRARRARTVS